MRLKSLEPKWLAKVNFPNWLVIVLALIFIFRIPSFFEPYYHAQEMILLAKLPISLFWLKTGLAAWMMATTILFWKLASALFPKNELAVKISVSAFATLTTIPLLEGQIAHAELFTLSPAIAAFLILLTQKLSTKNLFFAGTLFSIAALFRAPGAFDLGAIVFLWLTSTNFQKKEIANFIRQTVLLFVSFAIPIVLSTTWRQYPNIPHWGPAGAGPLLAILFAGLLLLFVFRKKLSKKFILATSWLLFSLFASLLPGHPYPHHLVQVIPAVSLLIGFLARAKSIEQSLAIIPLFLLLLGVVRFQLEYHSPLPYYQRFISLITGQTSLAEYFAQFDKNIPRNYEIAKFIVSSSSPKDKVFIWGDSSAIYALSKRLPAGAANGHPVNLSNPDETIAALILDKPKFIIVLPNSPPFPPLTNFLQSNYLLIENIKGATVWKSTNFNDIN